MKVSIVALCFFASLVAQAADTKLSVNPDIRLDSMYYPTKVSPDYSGVREIYTLSAPGSVRFAKEWKFRFNPELSGDPQNASKAERFFADPREAYMQWQKHPFTFQLGWNTFTWGDTDVFNPLDVVNQHRYQDPLRSEKLGAPSLTARWEHGPWSLEGVYVIRQRKSLLPGENSRWLPRDIYSSESIGSSGIQGTVTLPSNVNYNYSTEAELDHALSNNFGARIKGKFSGLDVSLVGFQGAANAPMVGLSQITVIATSFNSANNINFVVSPNVYLQATYYKIQMAGASFVSVLGDFLLKGESAYTKPVSAKSGIPLKGFDNVLALERGFDVGGNTLTAILEGTYAYHQDPVDNGSTSLSRMFDRAGILALRYAIGEKWTVLSSFLRDTKYKGNFYRGQVSYLLRDSLTLDLTADVIGGETGTPLGTYAKNDRGIFGLEYRF